MLAEQAQRQQDQIVEIHRVAGVQRGFIALGNMLGQCANAFITEDFGVLAAVLELAQHRQHRAGIGLFALGGNGGEDFLHRRELFRFVVDDEILFVAELLYVLAQNADAKGMERADGRTVAFLLGLALRQQLVHALLHFACGLVGERHAENVAGRDAALDHVRDAKSDDARLARARAGEDEHRAFDGLGGHALLRVERVQIHHRARSLSCHKTNASAQRIISFEPQMGTDETQVIRLKFTGVMILNLPEPAWVLSVLICAHLWQKYFCS